MTGQNRLKQRSNWDGWQKSIVLRLKLSDPTAVSTLSCWVLHVQWLFFGLGLDSLFAFCFGGVGLCWSSCNVTWSSNYVVGRKGWRTGRFNGQLWESSFWAGKMSVARDGDHKGHPHTHTYNYLFPAPLFQCSDGDSDAWKFAACVGTLHWSRLLVASFR